ncbi:MAG TPA: aminopeptidase P family protein [bacterium (Candidatus Stahlbacteria)]|nr:aminopeptidase P family protein [Candidatus Stahlbacteria bacterium]
MKRDIDQIMERKKIDAFIISGDPNKDPSLYYLLGVSKISAQVIKKRGEEPILIHSSMERDEAAKTGMRMVDFAKYDYRKILDEEKDPLRTEIRFLGLLFEEFGIKGKVAFYSLKRAGFSFHLLNEIVRKFDIEVVYEPWRNVLTEARETKGREEVDQIRSVGRRTCKVIDDFVKLLRGLKRKDGYLIKEDGSRFLLGDGRRFISERIYQEGLREVGQTILSIGRDAGVPHNYGNDNDPIEEGKTIIFDIFPQETGGGYFFDCTRTFVIGQASPDVKNHYDQVKTAQEMLIKSFKPDVKTYEFEEKVCDYFEQNGHKTLRSDRQTKEGYVHGLGHGLGLQVHEAPSFGLAKAKPDVLKPGMVFTVEPGLYYPEKGFGIRIEDVVYMNDKGEIENLTDYPKILEI